MAVVGGRRYLDEKVDVKTSAINDLNHSDCKSEHVNALKLTWSKS